MRRGADASAARRAVGHGLMSFCACNTLVALRGTGLPGQSTALHLRGRRCAPTALRCSVLQPVAELTSLGSRRGKGVPGQSSSRPLRGRRGAPTSLRCSAVWPAAELASLTSFAALRQWRRVSLRCALARAATRPALLGAPQARSGLSEHAFAGDAVVRHAREALSRQAVPGGGDLWSDEDRRPGVGARSALRRLTRRNCLSAVSKANEASSATRPVAENRSGVGAQRRPRNHEPPAGIAWRDAEAPLNDSTTRREAEAREQVFEPSRSALCSSNFSSRRH